MRFFLSIHTIGHPSGVLNSFDILRPSGGKLRGRDGPMVSVATRTETMTRVLLQFGEAVLILSTLVLCGVACGSSLATDTAAPERAPQETREAEPEPLLTAEVEAVDPAPPLTIADVRQVLSSHWCDRGPRDGYLEWDPVPGATRYQVDLVEASTCCDYEFAEWPEARWRTGQRLTVDAPQTPRAQVDSVYFRVQAVADSGEVGPWHHGMWECWWD